MNSHSQQENQWSVDELFDEDADAFQQIFAQQLDEPLENDPLPHGQHVFSPQQTNHGQQQGSMSNNQERRQLIEERPTVSSHFIRTYGLVQPNNQNEYPIDPLLQSQARQALDQANNNSNGTVDPRVLSLGAQGPNPQPSNSTGYGHHPQTNGPSGYEQQPAGGPSFSPPGNNHPYGQPVIGNPLWNMPGRNDFQRPISPIEIDLLNLAPAPWPANVAVHQPGPSQPNAQPGITFFPSNPAIQSPLYPQQQQPQQPPIPAPFQQPLAAPQAPPAAAPNNQAGNAKGKRKGSRSSVVLRPWSAEEVRRAQQMREDGFTDKEIGQALNRSENSVAGKLWRLEGNDPHASYMKGQNGGPSA